MNEWTPLYLSMVKIKSKLKKSTSLHYISWVQNVWLTLNKSEKKSDQEIIPDELNEPNNTYMISDKNRFQKWHTQPRYGLRKNWKYLRKK